jgi:hypothetical protein
MQSISEINVKSALQNESLLLEGIEHSNIISNLIASFLNMSISLNSPMTKSSVIELCKFIELLKVVLIYYIFLKY